MLAGEYAKLVGSDLLGAKLADLRAQAQARVAPSLTESSEENFLRAFAEVVAERTREEDFEAFRHVLQRLSPAEDDVSALARILSMVVRKIRDRQQKEAFSARSSAGGQAAGEVARIAAEPWQAKCVERARQMLDAGASRRDLAGRLAPGFGKSPSQVRRVLKKNNL